MQTFSIFRLDDSAACFAPSERFPVGFIDSRSSCQLPAHSAEWEFAAECALCEVGTEAVAVCSLQEEHKQALRGWKLCSNVQGGRRALVRRPGNCGLGLAPLQGLLLLLRTALRRCRRHRAVCCADGGPGHAEA